MKSMKVLSAALLALSFALPGQAFAEFKIGIMQDQSGEAVKYKPLIEYLNKKGVPASFATAKDYPTAATMFSGGQVDAMFSGSGIAGSMIIKDLAAPVVRPVGKDGNSTYWAVIVAKKGTPKFDGKGSYFAGKKVAFTSLASSGEFFFRSIPGAVDAKPTIQKAASHGSALDAVERGLADIAIVKNRVWDKNKDKYAGLEVIGEDKGQNPDSTLMVSKKTPADVTAKVSTILLGVQGDSSPEANAVKESLGIQGFIKTTAKDFDHNLSLLKSAGVTPAFNFSF